MSSFDHSDLVEVTTGSKTIFEGHVISLRVDDVQLPDGRAAKREVVGHPGAVAIVPILLDGSVVMVKQWRQPANQVLLELPAGSLGPGEDPLETAKRELIEETGYRAGEIKPLVGYYAAPGFCAEYMHVFIATDLTPGDTDPDHDENLQTVIVPWERAMEMCWDGTAKDSKTLIGLLMCNQATRSLYNRGDEVAL